MIWTLCCAFNQCDFLFFYGRCCASLWNSSRKLPSSIFKWQPIVFSTAHIVNNNKNPNWKLHTMAGRLGVTVAIKTHHTDRFIAHYFIILISLFLHAARGTHVYGLLMNFPSHFDRSIENFYHFCMFKKCKSSTRHHSYKLLSVWDGFFAAHLPNGNIIPLIDVTLK